MFLKKITKLKTVGRFRSAAVRGGEYGKLALFYGGNGRGKTTICALLRSLQLGEPLLVVERKTLGAISEPEVEFLFNDGQVRFANGSWNVQRKYFHIFDGQFVADNVHGGFSVDTDHRRNFYRIVVGDVGVALAKALDEIDAQATQAQSDLKTSERVLSQHVPNGMKLNEFVGLVEDPKIDDKIADATKRRKAAVDAAAIRARRIPNFPELPNLPNNYAATVEKTIADVSADAAARTQAHIIKHHLHEGGEQWLSYGLGHIEGNECPFCGQDLSANALVESYSGYFSAAYQALSAEIARLRTSVETELAAVRGARIVEALRNLEREAEYWRAYSAIDFSLPEEVGQIEGLLEALRTAALARVDSKIAAPLAVPIATEEYRDALSAWRTAAAALQLIAERWKTDVAPLVTRVKEEAGGADKQAIEAELTRLTAVRNRHSDQVKPLVDDYQAKNKSKTELEGKRKEKKKLLDEYDEKIFNEWERAINRFLTAFGAGFRLVDAKKSYQGKVPQCAYGLMFGDNTIDVGAKTVPGQPSFKTAMSAGDKNTFALAFFFAQLERDGALGEKVVVFDDPFTSLDEFRREFTAKSIVRLAQDAAQVVVLSHDKYFLNTCFGHVHGFAPSTLQLSLSGDNISIEEWNIVREVKEGYLQDHMALLEFEQGTAGTAKEMRTLMRPLLEKYIRYRFPNQMPDDKWLGEMIAIVRADENHPLRDVLQELEDINDYTAPFHHDPNTPFNDDEVRTHVQRTLAIVGGC